MEEKKTSSKKKNTTSRTTTKKSTTTNKSNVKREVKKPSEEKKNKIEIKDKQEKGLKDKISSLLVLKIIFVLLAVLVIVLGIIVYQRSNDENYSVKANIVIPVVTAGDEFDFSINAAALAQSNTYVFKVTNFKDKTINSIEMPYQVTIENGTDSVIKVTKNGESKDLMLDQKNTVINGEPLGKDKKDYVYYTVKMTSHGNIGSQDIISIKISSTKEG